MAIIEVEGASGAGKTSLIAQSISSFESCTWISETLQKERPPKIQSRKEGVENDFFQNQIWFIENVFHRYACANELLKKFDHVFLDTGLVSVLLFSKFYPVLHHQKWDIMGDVKTFLESEYGADKKIANRFIFLDSDARTLRERKTADTTRARENHESNLLFVEGFRSFFHLAHEARPDSVLVLRDIKKEFDKLKTWFVRTEKPSQKPWTLGEILEILDKTTVQPI